MSLRPKDEVLEIRRVMAELKKAPWLGPGRRWWPNYLFHCTDILNAVNILRHGELLSRVQAKTTGRLQVDIASPDIIAQTELKWQDYVRLYFRPRTPTQYANEGFRPIDQRQYGAHCPVPIYFLFKAESVLERADCLFTDGNVAAGEATPSNSIVTFRQIPFDLVYHDTWFEPVDRGRIVYHRNAEVLVPRRLGLSALSFIFCRSQAEYATLLYLVPAGPLTRWVDMIGVRPNLQLFFNRWTFVEQVEMSPKRLLFRFNKASATPGPFDAHVEIVEPPSGLKYAWHNGQFEASDVLDLSLHNMKNPQDYSVRLLLDQHLAFAGRYQQEELPF